MNDFDKKILLIDDNVLNKELVSDILEGSICQLMHCIDPRAGLRELMIHKPDLILLDLDMPEVNGLEVLKQIRSMRGTQNLPVFMFTGHSAREIVDQILKLGVSDYIIKPFEALDLITKLNRFFGRNIFERPKV